MYSTIVLSLAKLISILFHPALLFLPIPYIIVLRTTLNVHDAIKWTFFSWIFIFAICVFVYYQVKKGRFTNFDISKREQRPQFFLFLGMASIVYIMALLLLHGPYAMVIVTLGIFLGLILLDLINTKIKASIHVAAVTSILLSFVILNGIEYVWVLLLVPFVAWSRIYLHRHTVMETVTGAAFGGFLTMCIYVMIEYIFKA